MSLDSLVQRANGCRSMGETVTPWQVTVLLLIFGQSATNWRIPIRELTGRPAIEK